MSFNRRIAVADVQPSQGSIAVPRQLQRPDTTLQNVRVLVNGRIGTCPACRRLRIISASGPLECFICGRGEIPGAEARATLDNGEKEEGTL